MDVLRGFALLARSSKLRALALTPALGGIAAYVALGIVGWVILSATALRDWQTLERLAVVAIYLIAFPVVFFLLASGLLALIFDPLAHGVDEAEGGAPNQSPARGVVIQDAVVRVLLNLGLGAAAFGVTLLLPPWIAPVPGFAAAAVAATLDFTAPASLRRGRTLGAQLRDFARRPDPNLLVFAAVAGFLSLVPVIGLLVAPALVVGGTLLVRRRDGAATRPRAKSKP